MINSEMGLSCLYFHTQFLISKVFFISSHYNILGSTYKSKVLLKSGGFTHVCNLKPQKAEAGELPKVKD